MKYTELVGTSGIDEVKARFNPPEDELESAIADLDALANATYKVLDFIKDKEIRRRAAAAILKDTLSSVTKIYTVETIFSRVEKASAAPRN